MFRLSILLLAIAGIISCSDSSTGPETYEPSKFFPLLPGAQWKYSLLYAANSQGNSSGGIRNQREYGNLVLSVSEELGNGQFWVNVDFSVDSLKYSYRGDMYGIPFPGDTSYTKYAIYDTSFSCAFRAVKEPDKEHVYYRLSGTEKQFYGYDKGIYQDIDLSLFTLGRYELFDRPMKYEGVQQSKYIYRHWGTPVTEGYDLWHTEAAFDLFSGGLIRVYFSSCINCGMISHQESSIEFKQVAFNPGGEA